MVSLVAMVIGVISMIINLTNNYKNILVEANNPMPLENNLKSNPFNIVCYGSGKSFETNGDRKGDWVQIKVKRFRISAVSYRIKTFDWGTSFSHLKKWELRASNDNKT